MRTPTKFNPTRANVARRDARILQLRRSGLRAAEIARRCGTSLRTVFYGLERERRRAAELEASILAPGGGGESRPESA